MRESHQNCFPHSFPFNITRRCQIATQDNNNKYTVDFLHQCPISCFSFFCMLTYFQLLIFFFVLRFCFIDRRHHHWLTNNSLKAHTQSLDQNIYRKKKSSPVLGSLATLTQCHFNRTILSIVLFFSTSLSLFQSFVFRFFFVDFNFDWISDSFAQITVSSYNLNDQTKGKKIALIILHFSC